MKTNNILTIILFAGIISIAQAEVNINLGPPPITFSRPAKLIMMPWSGVYFVPDNEVEVFYYKDYWWTEREDRWYQSKEYNGPWEIIQRKHVPNHVLKVPKNYRSTYKNKKAINYLDWDKKHQTKKRRKQWAY